MAWWSRRRSRSQEPPERWEHLQAEIQRARRVRRELLVGREVVVSQLAAVLFRYDPIGINFGDNTYEYRPEAETIALRLCAGGGESDVLQIVHEEFTQWFGADIAGHRSRYTDIAAEVWAVWQAAQ